MRKPKKLTFEERLASSYASAAAAISVFESIAADLEHAAEEKDAIKLDIKAEVTRLDNVIASIEEQINQLFDLADEAELAADQHRTQATNVRALLGN